MGERKHGWALSVRSLGVAAKEVRTPAVLSSPCPRSCPVSGASVRCPAGPVQVIGVRCGRLSVQVSSVRPPASVVSDRNEVVGRGGGAGSRTAGMAGVGVSPAVSTTARRLPEVGAWPSRLAQVVLG